MLARLARVSPGALAALLWLCAADETALAANPAKIAANCRKEIVKAAAKLFQKEAAILKTCRDKAATGKLCNVKAQAKEQKSIDQARAKFSKAITKKCGGKDKTCGAFDADATQPSLTDIGWNVGTCPEFEAKGCTNAIADCDGIATCIQCIAELSVHQALDLSYPPGRPAPTDKAQKKLKTCQTTIGKEAVSFLIKRSSALSACWVKRLSKPVTVCPGDAKTQKKLAKLEVTLNAKIAKKCTAFDNSTIALPATCVAVTSEGGTPCNTNLVSAADVATCVGCVTTFNVDCVDRLGASSAGATYPAGCITAVPTPTQTPTPTLTPTPTVTPTPGTCGDNQIQPPEDCDGAATVGRKCGPAFACDGSCNCACPTRLHFAGDATDPNSILDSGWTGISHRAPIISNGDVTIGLSCSATSRDCGVCDVTGLVPNANADAGEHNNQRCSQDSSIKCTNDTPCLAGGGTCKFYFGAPLPLAAGGVTSCVINQFAAEVTGTANVETGDAATVARLNSRVFLGFTVDNPCARCVGDATINDGVAGGTCDSGPRLGLACDGNGLAPGRDDFGVTSLDCPMAGTGIAVLPINLTNATGTVTKTLSAANPKCTATGYTSERCLCSTCNNAAQEPCSVNTDCPANGGGDGICGGLRCIGGTTPGAPCLTCIGGANHAASCANVSECPGGTCQTLCGVCQGGIVPGTPCITAAPCNPKTCVGGSNNGASCSVNSECPGGTCPIPKTCLGGTNAGAPCTVASQCPGGSCLQGNCSGSCNVPGQATASNSCDSDGDATLDCVDDSSGEGTCTLGPLDSNCSAASGHPQRGCLNDGECGGGANTCQGANRRCFLTGGFAAEIGSNTLTAQGMADVPMGDVSHPTLGAVFCIGPTGLSSINNVAGLPGPGRVTIAGTAEGLP